MGILDEMKEVVDLIRKVGDADLYRKIAKLEGEVIDLTRDKRRAEEEVEELQRALKFTKELVLKDGLYWLQGDAVPFCTRCFDAEKKAIRIKRLALQEKGHRLQCPNCQTLYSQRQGGVI